MEHQRKSYCTDCYRGDNIVVRIEGGCQAKAQLWIAKLAKVIDKEYDELLADATHYVRYKQTVTDDTGDFEKAGPKAWREFWPQFAILRGSIEGANETDCPYAYAFDGDDAWNACGC